MLFRSDRKIPGDTYALDAALAAARQADCVVLALGLTPEQRNGDVSWGRIWWGFDTLGLPGKPISLGVENQHHRLGRFVLLAEAGTRVSQQQLLAAVTLADQAGTALGVEAVPA